LSKSKFPPEDLDSTLRDIAKNYKVLEERLHAFTSNDSAVAALKQEVSKALEAGDFARTEKLLNEASEKVFEGARQLQEMATQRLLSAAALKAANGKLKETLLRYAEAATYYRWAAEWVERVPNGSEELLATYLNDCGLLREWH